MKKIKIKAILALVFSMLLVSSAGAFTAIQYNTMEEFEAAEGRICETAIDGCNTYFFVDGKIKGSTFRSCIDVEIKWSCTKYTGVDNVYNTRQEFEKAEGTLCSSASDGCNTYSMTDDGKVGAGNLMACPLLEAQIWHCIDYKADEVKTYATKEEFEKVEGLACLGVTDGCNTYVVGNDGKVGAGGLKACLNVVTAWSCTKKNPMVDILSVDEFAIYSKIKSGGLTLEAMNIIDEYTQKYVDRLSKMADVTKKVNLDALVQSIERYITNVTEIEKNAKTLELKLYILQLLKFNVQKEIFDINVVIETAKAEEEVSKMHFSWDLDNDGINDCEKDNTCDDTADYTLSRVFKYTCDNEEQFTYYYGDITMDDIVLNDNKTRRFYYLTRVESVDGVKYEDEINTIGIKGTDAIFLREDKDYYTNCKYSK